MLTEAAGDREAAYGVENHAGTPVYVHAKICVIDNWVGHRGIGQLQPPLLDSRLRAVSGRCLTPLAATTAAYARRLRLTPGRRAPGPKGGTRRVPRRHRSHPDRHSAK